MESKFNYKNFSVVIPIYNEEEILEESTNAIFSICKSMEIDFEIIGYGKLWHEINQYLIKMQVKNVYLIGLKKNVFK